MLIHWHLKNVYVRFYSNKIEALQTMCLEKKKKPTNMKQTRNTIVAYKVTAEIKKERVTKVAWPLFNNVRVISQCLRLYFTLRVCFFLKKRHM